MCVCARQQRAKGVLALWLLAVSLEQGPRWFSPQVYCNGKVQGKVLGGVHEAT